MKQIVILAMLLMSLSVVLASNSTNSSDYALTSTVSTVSFSYENVSNMLTSILSWVFVLGGMALTYFSWNRFVTWKRKKEDEEGGNYSE